MKTQTDIQKRARRFSSILGEMIRGWRIDAGMTLVEVAAQTGKSKQSLSRIELGEYQATTTDLWLIAQAIDADLGMLCDLAEKEEHRQHEEEP